MQPTAVGDIAEQRHRDDQRGCGWALLQERLRAVADARKAKAADEFGSAWALRQALIDLASAAEHLAEKMPAPHVMRQ